MTHPANTDQNSTKMALLFLEYLKANGFTDTFVTFEKESGVSAYSYNAELTDIRGLVLSGDFDELLELFEQLSATLDHATWRDLKSGVRLQQYLEAISSSDQSPRTLQRAMAALSELQKAAPEDLVQDAHSLLGMASVAEHRRFRSWTKLSGRLQLFDNIEESLKDIFGTGQRVSQDDYSKILASFLSGFCPDEEQAHIEDSKLASRTVELEYSKTRNFQPQFKQSSEELNRQSEVQRLPAARKDYDLEKPKGLGIQALPKAAMISQISHLNVSNVEDDVEEMPHGRDLPSRVKQSTRMSDLKEAVKDSAFSQSTGKHQDNLYGSIGRQSLADRSAYDARVSEVRASQENRTWKLEESQSSMRQKSQYRHQFEDSPEGENTEVRDSMATSKFPSHYDTREERETSRSKSRSAMHYSHIEEVKNSKIRPVMEEYQSSQIAASNTSALRHSEDYEFEDVLEVFTDADSLPIRTAAFSPDGEYLAVGSNSKKLTLYSVEAILNGFLTADSQTVQRAKYLELHNIQTGPIYTLDWAQQMNFLVLGSMDKTLKILYTQVDEAGLQVTHSQVLEGHDGIIRSVCCTDETVPLIVSAGQDSYLKIWDSHEGRLHSQIKGHHSHVYCAKVLLDNSSVFSVGVDKFIQKFDIRSGKVVDKISTSSLAPMNYISPQQSFASVNYYDLISKTKHHKKAKDLNPAQMYELMVAHQDGALSKWDIRSMAGPIEVISLHSDDCRSVEFDPSGRFAVSASFDQSVKILDSSSGKVVSNLEYHEDRVVLAKWHPFFPLLVSTSADCRVKVFSARRFVDTY